MEYKAYGEDIRIALKAMLAYLKANDLFTAYTNDGDQNFYFVNDSGIYKCELRMVNDVYEASLRKLESPVDLAEYDGPFSRGAFFVSMTF